MNKMTLRLFNTLTRKKDEFRTVEPKNVKMYNCGPTVYNFAHIGNFRAYVASDILKRYLLYKGYSVKQVMNITDVDDKTIRDSQKEAISLKDFTERYTRCFLEDLESLNISRPDIMPKATEHIKEMVEMVKILLEKKIAYKGDDAIYFDITKFDDYGKLSKIDVKSNKAGARVNQDEYDKENANDFALWKMYDESDGEVYWDTQVGKGRPGWHIECAAMSIKYLGMPFDIHTGGVDLIFPHHENEIAQAEAAYGKKFVNFWLHNEYILVDGKKMSKSLGNFYSLRDVLKKGYDPNAVRYLLMSSHYRQQFNFSFEGLNASKSSIERLNEIIMKLRAVKETDVSDDFTEGLIKKAMQGFEEAMDDDLNISLALSRVFDFIRIINQHVMDKNICKESADKIINFLKNIDSVLGVMDFSLQKIPEKIKELAEKRLEARKRKDFQLADKLRDEIKEAGFSIDDSADGYQLKKI
jgi:cysteinyl-tRNA synthetase